MEDSTVQLIKRVLPFTAGKIPLAVGFGISKPEHVKQVIAAGADAAIVGSAFINIIQKNNPNHAKGTPNNRASPQISSKNLKVT